MTALAIIFLSAGCTADITSDSPPDTHSKLPLIDAEKGEYSPLLFVTSDSNDERYAYLVGAVKDGEFYSAYQFKYNDNPLYDFDYETVDGIDTVLMKKGTKLNFYTNKGEIFKSLCRDVVCQPRGIDSFFEVRVDYPKPVNIEGHGYVGFTGKWKPFPREPLVEDGLVSCDLDGNGITDTVRWVYYKNDAEHHGYNVTVTYNNREFNYSVADTSDFVSRFNVFAVDMTGDGNMEIIQFYENYGSGITVYDLSNDKLDELFSYKFTTTP